MNEPLSEGVKTFSCGHVRKRGWGQTPVRYPKLKKLNISLIYRAIIVIFSVSRPMVNTCKFCKKEILIQPPGEPREQHLGDVRPKSSSYTKFHKRQNYRKGQTSRTCFFLQLLKLNSSAIYKSIILISSVNLTVISIYKFCRKEI